LSERSANSDKQRRSRPGQAPAIARQHRHLGAFGHQRLDHTRPSPRLPLTTSTRRSFVVFIGFRSVEGFQRPG
jgi:hypothetical protein